MSMPTFSAEASLYKTSRQYRLESRWANRGHTNLGLSQLRVSTPLRTPIKVAPPIIGGINILDPFRNPNCGFAPICNGVCCNFNQTCVNGKCTDTVCPLGQVACPWTPGQCCPPGLECCANNLCCDPSITECCGGRGCVPRGSCIQ
jgi:hypothetical protein